MTASSTKVINEIRFLVADTDPDLSKRRWQDEEIDAAFSDGLGIVTYGERDEGNASSLDRALAKLQAGAQLCMSLARDRARLKRWRTATGEQVDSNQEAERLESLGRSWAAQVNAALNRAIERNKTNSVTDKDPTGGIMNHCTINDPNIEYKFGKVNTLNKPRDR